jgi:MHS family alpha-ketoglutarate permease-like MFS transporter
MEIEKKQSSDNRVKIYFAYFFIMLVMVQILDTYTTHFLNTINSRIINDFLSDYPPNTAASIMALCIAIATLGSYVVFFNQFFADRIGRKPLLIITVFGMAVACILISLSKNIIQYTFSLFLLYLFFSSDIWAIYINEESPQNKRGFWTNMLLLGGIIGAVLIPLFRTIYVSESVSNWRGMTIFPIVLGIILTIVLLFALKESRKYKEMKNETLSIDATYNLFKSNLKTLFKSSRRIEFITILIISFISGLNYTFISLGETYASNSQGLNQNDINLIILTTSLSVFIGYLTTGLVADRYGRKPLIYVYSILLPFAVLIFIYGCNTSQNALFIVCLGGGMVYAVFWGLVVIIRIVTIEVTPTEARGTGSGLKSLMFAIGITTGLALGSIVTYYYGLAITFIIFSLTPFIINAPLNYFFLKETKDVDLSNVYDIKVNK